MQEHAANYSPPQNIVAREHPAGSQAYCPLPLQEGDEGLDWGTIATKGTPRAKRENNKLRAKLLRRTRLVVLITTFKVLLETLTWVPDVKVGSRWMFRSVSKANPIAQKQKRRIPISWRGIRYVYCKAFRKWLCANATSSRSP